VKKPAVYIFTILFMLILVAPVASMAFSKGDTENAEKRELSSFPKVTEEGKVNTAFFSQFDTWISEHMGLRAQLINAEAWVKTEMFCESPEDDVVLGSEGWLYYAPTVSDYQNVATISDRNINNIVNTLAMVSDYCKEQGATFVFTVAPNKNTLYGQFMPSRYVTLNQKGNLEKLVAVLSGSEVTYANLYDAFSNENEVLYQKRDSHWNYKGALLAYQTIMEASGLPNALFQGISFTERKDWDADLVNMVYSSAADDDLQLYPDYSYSFETKGNVVSDEALTIKTIGTGEGKLLMFRDSFGNTMWPYFAESFAEAEFSRVVPYRIDSVVREGYTTVVMEIVERNLSNLAAKAPMMEAPTVNLSSIFAYEMTEKPMEGYCGETATGLHVYGEIPEEILGDSYRVILVVKTGEGVANYEAFPIFEQELLSAETLQDNGYSAYIPVTEEQLYAMSLVVITNGETYVNNEVHWVKVTE